MRAIHPLNPLKIVSACSGGRRPSSEDDGAGRNASCGAFGGHFRRHRRSAMVVMVVVDRWHQIILIPTQHSYILDIWPPEINFTDLAKIPCCLWCLCPTIYGSPKFIIKRLSSLTNLLDTHFFYTFFQRQQILLIIVHNSENNSFPWHHPNITTQMSHEWYHHLRRNIYFWSIRGHLVCKW